MQLFHKQLQRIACALTLSLAIPNLQSKLLSGAEPESATTSTVGAPAATETPEQRAQRMDWWHDARFGMFIHWGIYSIPAGTYNGKQIPDLGEWIQNNAEIPLAEYAKYAEQFNPTKFDADEWVKLAKNAGMKYIIITSKHHDGFAMFKSAASPFNIVDATPFKRDPLKELAAACEKQGIKLGFYYSQNQDWNHPGGFIMRRNNRAHDWWDPAQQGSFDDYLNTIAIPQVKELLTNYGNVAVLWWDFPHGMTREHAAPLHDLLKLQPAIISNNRLGGGFKGDTETPEQTIPTNGYPGRDFETCMTINDTWGYKSYDTNFKSTRELLRQLIDVASKGGNYLLNVGPTAEGEIPEPERQRLLEVGAWLKTNGVAIYGATASPFENELAWGRATQKNGKLYLFVFDWPADGKLIVPLRNSKVTASLLKEPAKFLAVASNSHGLTITVPTTIPDSNATVIELQPDGPLEIGTN